MPSSIDIELMDRAIANAARVRFSTSPNPWVGAVVATSDGNLFDGATARPGGAHAEVEAIEAAGSMVEDATLYTTLEPCSHTGRTPPCTELIIGSGLRRIVVGVIDPDPEVSGSGIEQLRAAGMSVDIGVRSHEVEAQLRSYLHHRSTGRPYVVLKMAMSLDGRIAAPDGTSQWITGPEARREGHRLRAESDAVIVGAATVRADDPALTVRNWSPGHEAAASQLDPRRVVLGTAPPGAKVHPCDEMSGPPGHILEELGRDGVLQVLVEGGAGVASQFHSGGHVDQYELFIAPALFGGTEARPAFAGPGIATISQLWRGRIESINQLGDDLHVTLSPHIDAGAPVEGSAEF